MASIFSRLGRGAPPIHIHVVAKPLSVGESPHSTPHHADAMPCHAMSCHVLPMGLTWNLSVLSSMLITYYSSVNGPLPHVVTLLPAGKKKPSNNRRGRKRTLRPSPGRSDEWYRPVIRTANATYEEARWFPYSELRAAELSGTPYRPQLSSEAPTEVQRSLCC